MPYYVTKTNGDALVTVEDGTVDITSTDLSLVGKNYPTYGLALNQNFVKLLENFASADQPISPILGQLWYDSSNKMLYIYRQGAASNFWSKIANLQESASTPSDPFLGDLWFDTSSDQLKIYNGTSWITVGPQTTSTGLLRVAGGNNFTLQIGSTEVLAIDPSGRVNKPLQPIVHAYGRSGSSNFSTSGTSTFSIWIPNTVNVNVGEYYSAGVFTCPVDGLYRVQAHLTTLGKALGGTHIASWRKNDVDVGVKAKNVHDNSIQQCLSLGGIIEASKNDTITLVAATDASSYISYDNNSFSIELVA